jgi:hypothetical protein
MESPSAETEFVASEYSEAWSHYRHVENSRLQYLGFFFTVTLGSAALAIPILSGGGTSIEERLPGASVFLMIFEAFAFFVFVNLLRFDTVLRHYGDGLTKLRARRAELLGVGQETAEILSFPRAKRVRFRVQNTAETVVLSFMVVAAVLAVAALAAAISSGAGTVIAACASVVVGIFAVAVMTLQALLERDRVSKAVDLPGVGAPT